MSSPANDGGRRLSSLRPRRILNVWPALAGVIKEMSR